MDNFLILPQFSVLVNQVLFLSGSQRALIVSE